jgi:linoleoyl-CoA desaturase
MNSLAAATPRVDHACDGDAWRHSHNYMHHAFTNVEGRDRDIGYGFLRLFESQPWQPLHLVQAGVAVGLATLFQWGIALHDLEIDAVARGRVPLRKLLREARPVLRKALRQFGKDYVVFPVLAGPAFLPVLAGNLVANLVRNLWTLASSSADTSLPTSRRSRRASSPTSRAAPGTCASCAARATSRAARSSTS